MDKDQNKKNVTVCYAPSSRRYEYSAEFFNKVCIGIFTLFVKEVINCF